ncbi:MAG: transcription repressor NadR [Ruminococcaceae bacterium]|nr:transcription repressor NadR [Oscillospiraceae bacterium]
MKAVQRRKEIANYMMTEHKAISGTMLSEKFGVSRQIIVQDISALKTDGYKILSTHNGYIMQTTPLPERVFKVFHTREQTEDELTTIIDFGGTVADVFVWHKVYGKISAPLNISSRHHVIQFLEGVRTGKSSELMNVTGGYHYHTVRAETEEILDKIEKALNSMNYIVPEI